MLRKTVLTAILALCAVTVAPQQVLSGYVMLDPMLQEDARLELTEETARSLVFEWTAGGFDYAGDETGVKVTMSSSHSLLGGDERPAMTGLVHLPWGRTAEVILTGGELVPFSPLAGVGEPVALEGAPSEMQWVNLGESGIFRDLTVAPLTIHPVQDANDGTLWTATRLTFEVRIGEPMADFDLPEPDRPISSAFWPVYQSLLLNELDESGVRLADRKGSLLLVGAQSNIGMMSAFIEWKKQLGYNVVIHQLTEATPFSALRNTLAEYYRDLDPPLEYVMLVGDENRGGQIAQIPASRITNPKDVNENDVTDWPYAFVEGSDYFPEFWISRMTAGSNTEALNASARVVSYESNPFRVDDPNRWTHATLVAGNYSEGGATPLSPVGTSLWLWEHMMEDWGVTGADTLFWHNGSHQSTTTEVAQSINQGGIWVTYRGWGNATGWLAPEFHSSDVDNLTNAHELPVVLSCVCNTGDFGNPNQTKCFAEHMISAGNPNNPVGAVAAIAPSDLHTQTKYNNPILAGFFVGVYEEYLTNISQALFRAKMEIWNGHPNDRSTGEAVEFYNHVYHIFGDPTLSMWTRAPSVFTRVNLPDEIPYGQDYIEVEVASSGWTGMKAYVQLQQDDYFPDGGFVDENGRISLFTEGVEPGELEVIITAPNFAPVFRTIQVTEQDLCLGVSDWSWTAGGDEDVFPGENVELTITLRNTGTQAQTGVSATLSHPGDDLVTIDGPTADFGDIAAGETAQGSFSFTLNRMIQGGAYLELSLEITGSEGGPWDAKVWVPVGDTKLIYASHEFGDGSYTPGGDADITISFSNIGSVDATDITATLVSWDEAVTVNTAEAELGDIPAGETVAAQTPFQVSVVENTFGGRVVRYGVSFSSNGNEIGVTNFAIPLSGAGTTDPLGPDSYGYFAYDDTDTGFDNTEETVPTYQWWDLANNGGTLHELADDDNFDTELPFDFTYYGRTYASGSTITVSSNGWLSFTREEDYTRLYFRNWQIPCALGPRAMIAAFWDDLKPRSGEQTKVYTYHDEANGLFIVEWESKNRYLLDQMAFPAEFALVLYDPAMHPTPSGDGIIEIHYHDIANVDEDNNGATVGVMNEQHTIGLEYTYGRSYPDAAAEIENERAIRFTTINPDNYNPTFSERSDLPESFRLHANYPNPFNPQTEIRFDLVQTGHVTLAVYDILGREVARLVDRNMQPGRHRATFNAAEAGLSSGMFFVRLEAGDNTAMSKMIYLK